MSSETVERNGTLRSWSGGTAIRIAREFPHPQEVVWAMLTEPAHLAQWLAPGTIELRAGGAAKLNFIDSGIVIDSTVSTFIPMKTIAYSWSGPGEPRRPLRFDLEAAGKGTRLTMTLDIPLGEDAPRAAAGFEAHLEMLAAALEGVPIRFPFQLFKDMRAAYAA